MCLEVFQENLDIQSTFNEYMYQYFSTTEDKCSQARNQVNLR